MAELDLSFRRLVHMSSIIGSLQTTLSSLYYTILYILEHDIGRHMHFLNNACVYIVYMYIPTRVNEITSLKSHLCRRCDIIIIIYLQSAGRYMSATVKTVTVVEFPAQTSSQPQCPAYGRNNCIV